MGSANINDRSMEGDRDSEICLLIEKGKQVLKNVNKKKTFVNKKIFEMRTKLWMEHFGLELSDCEDPLSEETNNKILKNVKVIFYLYRIIQDFIVKYLVAIPMIKLKK